MARKVSKRKAVNYPAPEGARLQTEFLFVKKDAATFLRERFEALKERVPSLVFGGTSFSSPKQSVLDFTDETIPLWTFRLWAHEPSGLTFLGEHDGLIDKFRPGRTYISTRDEGEFLEALKFVREKPYVAFAASKNFCTYPDRGEEPIDEVEAKVDYERFAADKKAQDEAMSDVARTMRDVVFPKFLKACPLVSGICLIDNERNGSYASPKYSLAFSFFANAARKQRVSFESLCAGYSIEMEKVLTRLIDEEIVKKWKSSRHWMDVHRCLPWFRGSTIYTSYTRLYERGVVVVRNDKYGNIRPIPDLERS